MPLYYSFYLKVIFIEYMSAPLLPGFNFCVHYFSATFLFEKTFFFRCFAGSPLRMEEYDSVVEYRSVG